VPKYPNGSLLHRWVDG